MGIIFLCMYIDCTLPAHHPVLTSTCLGCNDNIGCRLQYISFSFVANYSISCSITSPGNGIWYVIVTSNQFFMIIKKTWFLIMFNSWCDINFWLKRLTFIGATTSIQNFGLAFIGFAAGIIKGKDETYVWLEIFYIAWLVIAILTTALLWFLDYRQYNYLFMTEKEKKVFETTPEYYKMMRMDMPKLDS